MRIHSDASQIQRKATIEEYLKAWKAGNVNLANRIEFANSGENLQSDWAEIDFEALRAYPDEY